MINILKARKRVIMGRNVLLIGGTGAMGMYLTPLLLEKGYRVYVTSRSSRDSDNPELIYLQGDGHDIHWLEEISKNKSFIAVVDFMMYDYAGFKANHIKLMTLGEQYFYCSSYRVYANETSIITEESPRKLDVLTTHPELKEDHYGISKARQENMLLESGKNNYIILRPGMTYSKNRFQYGAMDNFDIIRAVRGGKSILSEEMLPVYSTLTYGKDVAKMIAGLVGNFRANGQIYNVVVNESHTWQEISDIFHEVFELEMVPVTDELYVKITNQWRTMIDRRFNRIFDNKKILKDAGLTAESFTPLKDGLQESWNQSNQNRFFNARTNWRVHGMIDFYTRKTMSLENVSEENKKVYFDTKTALQGVSENKMDLAVKQFKVSDKFWHVRSLPWLDYLEFVRQGSHTFSSPKRGENRWVSYLLPSKLQIGRKYHLEITLMCDSSVSITPFLSGPAPVQKLSEMVLTEGHWTTYKTDFVAEKEYKDFSFTATDIPISGKRVCIKDITVTAV